MLIESLEDTNVDDILVEINSKPVYSCDFFGSDCLDHTYFGVVLLSFRSREQGPQSYVWTSCTAELILEHS